MLANYLKLSLRLMSRNPFFTFINVVGLGVGIATFFVLQQYSYLELNSDRQWKDWDRIVRCGLDYSWTDNGESWSRSFYAQLEPEVAARISKDLPEIEAMTRIFRQENFTPEHIPFHGKNVFLTRVNDKGELISFRESSLAYADPNLFKFFSIRLLEGNPDKVLAEINSVVLSQKMARRYFGAESPLDKTLLINNTIPLKVTGVYEDLPQNTHLEFEAVISTVAINRYITTTHASLGGPHVYFRLAAGTDPDALQKKMNDKEHYWHYWAGMMPPTEDKVKAAVYVQRLADVPFSNNLWDYFKPKSKFFLKMLAWTGALTLLISWINYVQLSTSFYIKRIKEIGVRKTSGARSRDFAKQFMIESLSINFLSLLFAATIVQLCKGPLTHFFEFNLPGWGQAPLFVSVVTLVGCVLGVALSGLLPVVLLRVNSPHSLLKKTKNRAVVAFGKPLVALQFTISIVLIVWVFTVHKQVDHVLGADYGLNHDAVVLVDLPQVQSSSFKSDLAVLMEKMKSIPGITEVTSFSTITGDADNNVICLVTLGGEYNCCVDTNGGIDESFIPFFNLKLLAGRNFSPDTPADSGTVIISARAVQRLGFKTPQEAIGQLIAANRNTMENPRYQRTHIIGVVEDYHGGKGSLLKNDGMGDHGGIALTYKDQFVPANKPQKLAFRIEPSGFSSASESIEKIYRDLFPGQLFRAHFLDDNIAGFYEREKTARNQILLFSIIAIGIACLGLLGTISNKVIEKTKEIGIRKVLGARLFHIAQILLDTTTKQVAIAVLLGIPVAHYLTQQYLQKFSDRVQLQWWHYAVPVTMLVIMMLGSVVVVVYRAAKSNPVDALKVE